MSDTNNVQVAEHLMEWLREKGANYQNIFINIKLPLNFLLCSKYIQILKKI